MTSPEYVKYCIDIKDKYSEFHYLKTKKTKKTKKSKPTTKHTDDLDEFEIIYKDCANELNQLSRGFM
jgi:hypothetical protein